MDKKKEASKIGVAPSPLKNYRPALAERPYTIKLANNACHQKSAVREHTNNNLHNLNYDLFVFLDKLPLGIALISQKTFDITYANHVCLDIFACKTLKEEVALSWSDYLLPDSYHQFLELMTKPGIKHFYPDFFDLQIKLKNGAIRDIRISLSDLLKHDRDCSLLFIEDITDQLIRKITPENNGENHNLKALVDAFSYRIIEVQEDERRKISYELHDEIGQNLTAIQLLFMRICESLQKYITPENRQSEDLINAAFAQIRRFTRDLNPIAIKGQGLLPALLEYIEGYKSWSGLMVGFTHTGLEGKEFPCAISNTVYRIMQESLTNVARHAGVKKVDIDMRVDQQTFLVCITDKGKGFDPKTVLLQRPSGIYGMHERLLLLKGKLDIESAPGKGTRLTAVIPLLNIPDHKGSNCDIDFIS